MRLEKQECRGHQGERCRALDMMLEVPLARKFCPPCEARLAKITPKQGIRYMNDDNELYIDYYNRYILRKGAK